MYSILVLFENVGVCAYFSDTSLQTERLKHFNTLSGESFTHPVFGRGQSKTVFDLEDDFLGQSDTKTYSFWSAMPSNNDPSKAKMAISIQYLQSDLSKLMVEYVNSLNVPLYAIAKAET